MIRIRLVILLAIAGLWSCIPARAELPKVKLEQVYPGLHLDRPLLMQEAPDGSGRMFFMEQTGIIRIAHKGSDGTNSKVFLTIANGELYDESENEKGLLGFTFHPKFKDNGKIYVYYTLPTPDGHIATCTSEYTVSKQDPDVADPASERRLLIIQRPRWNHEGGCLAFGPDGYLYISTGDGGYQRDPFTNGQNLNVMLGKMLRIDVDKVSPGKQYSIPADNPFVNNPNAKPEIWVWGLRNPWRFSFDQQTGQLWEGDVGEDNWEEVNLLTKGGNYGWSVREGAHDFREEEGHPGPFIDPVMEYAHTMTLAKEGKFPDHSTGACIIGGYVYRGKKYPSLNGVYIYGDYIAGTIWGFRYA